MAKIHFWYIKEFSNGENEQIFYVNHGCLFNL
eukprot:UN09219